MTPHGVSLTLVQTKPTKVWQVKLGSEVIGHLKRLDQHSEQVTLLDGRNYASPDRAYLLAWSKRTATQTPTDRIRASLDPNPWDI